LPQTTINKAINDLRQRLNDYKFSTVCEKNEKMSGPLGRGGFFLTHTVG